MAVVVAAAFITVRQNIVGVSHGVLQRVIQEDRITAHRPGEGGPTLPYFTVDIWRQDREYRAYVTGGALGSLPRMAASTIVGAALWEIGSPRFWLSLLPKAALTGLSLLLWRVWRKQ